MHHQIFPVADTYITNRQGFADKNFGIDEILQVGTTNTLVRSLNQTREYTESNTIFVHQTIPIFTGTFSGSFGGTSEFALGTISGSNLIFQLLWR